MNPRDGDLKVAKCPNELLHVHPWAVWSFTDGTWKPWCDQHFPTERDAMDEIVRHARNIKNLLTPQDR